MQSFNRLLPVGVLTTVLTLTTITTCYPSNANAAPQKQFHVSLTLYFANGTSSSLKWFEDDAELPGKTPGSVLRACREAGDLHLATDANVVDYSCSIELID